MFQEKGLNRVALVDTKAAHTTTAANAHSVSEPACAPMTQRQPSVYRWIKTECGRAKFTELAARPGVLAWLRLVWFVVIASLRDWRLADPDQSVGGSPP